MEDWHKTSGQIQRRDYVPDLAIFLEVVSTVFLAVRLYVRFSRNGRGSPGIDDFFIVIGWILGTALTILVILGANRYGFDRHVRDVPTWVIPTAVKVSWLSDITFFASTCCIKLSTLTFYRRLFNPFRNRNLFLALWIAISFTAFYTTIFVLLQLTSCRPFSSRWKKFDLTYKTPYHCTDISAAGPVFSIFNTLSDLFTVIIPLTFLVRLRMPNRQKLGLYSIFTAGLLVVIAGIARTVYSFQLLHGSELTWIGCSVFICSLYAYHVSLVCACAPSLRSFFERNFRFNAEAIISRIMFGPGKDEKHLGNRVSRESLVRSPSFTEVHETNWTLSRNMTTAYEEDVEAVVTRGFHPGQIMSPYFVIGDLDRMPEIEEAEDDDMADATLSGRGSIHPRMPEKALNAEGCRRCGQRHSTTPQLVTWMRPASARSKASSKQNTVGHKMSGLRDTW